MRPPRADKVIGSLRNRSIRSQGRGVVLRRQAPLIITRHHGNAPFATVADEIHNPGDLSRREITLGN
jgi:hypothetical protein